MTPPRRAAGSSRAAEADPDRPRDAAKRSTLKKLSALGLLAVTGAGAFPACGRRRSAPFARERKLIVLGIDGLDPGIISHMMAEGRLPNMARLRSMGGLRKLTSSVPPQSPVAWANFITGQDPGGHGVYGFTARDARSYRMIDAIATTTPPGMKLPVGPWQLPLSRAHVDLQRRGPAFWDLLAERGIPCEVHRVPTNFPPRDTGARQLGGLGIPDLRGSLGEYFFFTDAPAAVSPPVPTGPLHEVEIANGHCTARLEGPWNTLHRERPRCAADFEVWLDRDRDLAKIDIQGRQIVLRRGEWSEWTPVQLDMIPHVTAVRGICRFYLKEVRPHLKLYVSPINIDPADPGLPIDAPAGFAEELARRHGRFHTLGLPEDSTALNHGALTDDEYLQQSSLVMGELRTLYEGALSRFQRGLLFYYFGTSDRTQHMFWRTIDPRHPAHEAKAARAHGSVIDECYRTSDEIVGQALDAADGDTTVIVLSDHGFAPYYRAFYLNAWLFQNGYLAMRNPGNPRARLTESADWSRTSAYALGLNNLYLNVRGREGLGTVDPEQRLGLAHRLAKELRGLTDPETGDRIVENVYVCDDIYPGAQPERAPDLILGYARGYRCAVASAQGRVGSVVAKDNKEKWSGDHCIDRSLVPGTLLASRPMSAESPALTDVTVSVLTEFGLQAPGCMIGRPVW